MGGKVMIREKIFISHATPEDTEFAVWLASKLELFGYKTWVDANSLAPADDFWNTIESAIRNEAIRFVFVATKESIHKDGVKKELAVADRVRKNIENFIIPSF